MGKRGESSVKRRECDCQISEADRSLAPSGGEVLTEPRSCLQNNLQEKSETPYDPPSHEHIPPGVVQDQAMEAEAKQTALDEELPWL